jgi:hypothetical protein
MRINLNLHKNKRLKKAIAVKLGRELLPAPVGTSRDKFVCV